MKKITLKVCIVLIYAFATFSFAQNGWKKTTVSDKEIEKMNEIGVPTSASLYSFDIYDIQSRLTHAPESGTFSGKSNTILELPDATGKLKAYRIEEASVMAPELQAKYPEIRSYAGYGDNGEYLRFTVTPYNGFNGIILYPNRSESIVIQDIPGSLTNKTAIFKRADRKGLGKSFECSTTDEVSVNMDDFVESNRAADDSTLRIFDLAMSVSAEYSAYHGNTLGSVNAAIATTVTRQNSVYEIDFAVRLVLIGTNDNVIYFTPGTPYSSTSDTNYNSTLQSTLTSVIGEANYDVGHLMAAIGNNGNAGCIGCICVNGSKGSGYTTSTAPIGDTFDIDFVAHELGHQFGGRHTFTHSSEGAGVAQMEPGSGSTIMGYAGITGPTDVQSNSDPYFHAISIEQITTHAKSRPCDVETPTGNTNPVVSAGSNLTLPIGTPFRLTGSGSDADGDTITYCWEQYDEEDAANAYPDPTSASNNRPLFRSYSPTTSPVRTFPMLSDLVANGVNGNTFEKVPTVGRTADFRLTARDNRAGGAANTFSDMMVTWDASRGPLEVTSQAATGIVWNNGNTETITWNENNTNLMAGASTVNILLSLDGGLTYPTTLASGIPNNGSTTITVPNSPAPYCRIMIQPTSAPFFAINTVDFAIDYSIVTNCTTYSSGALGTSIPDGAGANSPGTPIFNIINVSGETGTLNIEELKVNVDVTHTYIEDLVVQLLAPDGATFNNLWARNCGGNDNLDVTFQEGAPAIVCASPTVGTYSPGSSMASFDNQNKNGDWQIAVVDYYNGDTGTLNDWSVEFCTTTETALAVEENQFDVFGVYPNPSNGEVTIKLSSNKDVNVSLFDIRGRKIYNQLHSNTSDSFNEKVDFSSMASGVYMLDVQSGSKRAVKKLVIQ